jgi:hypothetical protein
MKMVSARIASGTDDNILFLWKQNALGLLGQPQLKPKRLLKKTIY